MTADVQRELAAKTFDALDSEFTGPRAEVLSDRIAAALLPTVQALIADAEKRAAAKALRDAAKALHVDPLLRSADFASYVTGKLRALAAALD